MTPRGTRGDDQNKRLLEAARIVARPFAPRRGGPRLMCMVYATAERHADNVRAIRETWAPGCDGFLTLSTRNDSRVPALALPHDGPEAYDNMWQKVRAIWRFAHAEYGRRFDFFVLGGHDLYVLPQNLRDLLATYATTNDATNDAATYPPLFLGRRFVDYAGTLFNSGGAGYVLSAAALDALSAALDDARCGPRARTSMEDVMVAKCLAQVAGVVPLDTRDAERRERFHPFAPGAHLTWKPPAPGKPRDWYEDYNRQWGLRLGADCCAPDSVSFHYVKKPAMMRHIHALLYDCEGTGAG